MSPTAKRRLRRGIIALLIIGIMIMLAWFMLVPALVHRQVVALFRGMGYDVRLRVTSVGLSSTTLRNIQLGAPGEAGIDQLTITYSLGDLWQGRVNRIAIDGGRLVFTRNDTGFAPHPLLVSRPSATTFPAATTQPTPNLPFDALTLRDLVVSVSRQDTTHSARIGFSLTRAEKGAFNVISTALPDGQSIDIDGALAADGTFNAAVKGKVDLRTLQQELAAFGMDLGLATLDGTAALNGNLFYSPGWTRFSGRISDVNASITMLQAGTNLKTTIPVLDVDLHAIPGGPVGGYVQASAATVEAPASDVSATGVYARVAVESIAPLKMYTGQWVTIEHAKYGSTEAKDGTAIFWIDEHGKLVVERADVTAMDGTMELKPTAIDLATLSGNATLLGHSLDLAAMLKLTQSQTVTGTGRFNFELPLGWQNRRLNVGQGKISLAQNGSMQLANPDDYLGAGTGSGIAGDARRQIVEALRDFVYDRLGGAIYKTPEGITAELHLAGQGRTGSQTPVDLTLRFNLLKEQLAPETK